MRPLLIALTGFALATLVVAPTASAAPEPTCVPTSGGLDYHSFLCVDPSEPKCPVYTLQHSDWGVQKRCYP